MKCIIVNDDIVMKSSIEALINQSGELFLLSVFNTTSEASGFLDNNRVDVVFFDIQMYDANTPEFIQTIPTGTFVIYISVFSPFISANMIREKANLNSLIAERFRQAIDNAKNYLGFLRHEVSGTAEDYFVI